MRIHKQINKITRLADISKRYYWSPGFPKRNHSPNKTVAGASRGSDEDEAGIVFVGLIPIWRHSQSVQQANLVVLFAKADEEYGKNCGCTHGIFSPEYDHADNSTAYKLQYFHLNNLPLNVVTDEEHDFPYVAFLPLNCENHQNMEVFKTSLPLSQRNLREYSEFIAKYEKLRVIAKDRKSSEMNSVNLQKCLKRKQKHILFGIFRNFSEDKTCFRPKKKIRNKRMKEYGIFRVKKVICEVDLLRRFAIYEVRNRCFSFGNVRFRTAVWK
ncbi:hypothetical protein LXL04_029735 [Taraxacum kok-saghyz]